MRRPVRSLLLLFGAATIPVALASAAFACQVLATLHVSPKSGPGGTTVTATGDNYSSNPNASPVVVHLDTRTGRSLASTRPDGNGHINTSFTVPGDVSTGSHALVATQYLANGAPKSGTPGRATFTVSYSGASAAHASASPLSVLTSPITLGGWALLAGIGLVRVVRRRAASAA